MSAADSAKQQANQQKAQAEQQQKAAEDAAKAAEDAAKDVGKTIGGWFSDARLKENVEFVGSVAGLNTYTYNYIWDTTPQIGVMAQDLLDTDHADAVSVHESGYYQVDYTKLPLTRN